MDQNWKRGAACLGVLLALYLLLAFLIPFVKTAVFWFSFVFTLIAFGVAAYALYMAFLKKPDARSRFYGFPIARIGVLYCGIQLAVGLLFMALGKWIPAWLAVLVYAAMLGAAVIGLVSADAVVETIHTQDGKLKKDVAFMRVLQSKANQMAEIERDLSAAVDDLQAAIVDGDNGVISQLARKADTLLSERNRLCKLNKE